MTHSNLQPEVCSYDHLTIEGQAYAGRVLSVSGEFTVNGQPVDSIISPNHTVQWYRISQGGSQVLVATYVAINF
jgi:hypothetical protein